MGLMANIGQWSESHLDNWLRQRLRVHLPGNVQEQIAQASDAVLAVAEGAINPPGTILLYAATIVPSGYLFCDGASYLIADYPDLSAVIRGDFGGVDATHFYVPALNGRVPVGVNTSNPDVAAVGNTETVGLLATRGPQHFHDISHSHSMQAHTHSATTGGAVSNVQSVARLSHAHDFTDSSGPPKKTTDLNTSGVSVADDPHTHSVTTGGPSSANTGGASTTDSGSKGPAFLTLNAVIKT